jgi:hypothetical protein
MAARPPSSRKILKKSSLRSAILLRWQVRGSPSVANPLSGIKLHWSFILFRFAHGLFQLAGVARGCAAYGAEDAKQKVRFLLCSIFQTLWCLKNVRCLHAPLYQAAKSSFSAAW